MRKLKGIFIIAAFVLAFALGVAMAPAPAQASLPCTIACINGQLRVCCYNSQGVYECNNIGPCSFDF